MTDGDDVRVIGRDEVKGLLARGGVVLVEALGPAFYDDAHLPGAVNVPADQVDVLAPLLVPDRSTTVVVYCSDPGCGSSTAAARRFASLGYGDVYEYAGGKLDWIEAGLPVERGDG